MKECNVSVVLYWSNNLRVGILHLQGKVTVSTILFWALYWLYLGPLSNFITEETVYTKRLWTIGLHGQLRITWKQLDWQQILSIKIFSFKYLYLIGIFMFWWIVVWHFLWEMNENWSHNSWYIIIYLSQLN